MVMFAILFCAVVAVTFLIQLQAYGLYHNKDAGTDASQITGQPIANEIEYEPAAEEQQSLLT
jgi:hypothetical protein